MTKAFLEMVGTVDKGDASKRVVEHISYILDKNRNDCLQSKIVVNRGKD